MKRFPTRSLGQILAIGFALMLLLLGVLSAAVYSWQSDSAAAERDFLERIAPLAEQGDRLERALLRFAIAARTYLLNPSQQRMNRYHHALAEVREALQRLQEAPKDADGRALIDQVSATLEPYLAESTRAIENHLSTPVDSSHEGRLSELRDRVILTLQRFADLQRGRTAAAIETMQRARDRVSTGVGAAIVVGALLSIAIAWFMARSVRKPVGQLVSIAERLEAGDWSPALQLVQQTEPVPPSAPERSELRRLARAIGFAATALEQREQRLQAQNEELQAQNEEIQAQSEELQAQSEEIQSRNALLKQQADELNEADRRKNRFLGVLAHELRNPMAPISNSIALLKKSAPGSETALRAQAMIERQSRHLIRLIDDLLDITRISQGKIRLQREELDLVSVVHECIEDQQAALAAGDRIFTLVSPETPVKVSGDRTRLAQIVGNLLGNAVKFTDRGGRIAVTVTVDQDARSMCLRVRDDGVGIERDLQPLLFEPFTQGTSSLDRTHGGLGLGLSLVRALVELHLGTASVHSDGPGHGAEFLITLPTAV
jgi:signal transduction histidine kinase